MKTASIRKLFEVGHFLYQLQSQKQKCSFAQEIEWVLDVILENLGILQVKGRFRYIVDTDRYEHVMTSFFKYCRNEIAEKDLFELVICPSSLEQVVNSNHVENVKSVHVGKLFELKYAIQINRMKGGSEIGLLRAEKRILNVILEELGGKVVI